MYVEFPQEKDGGERFTQHMTHLSFGRENFHEHEGKNFFLLKLLIFSEEASTGLG